MKKLLAAFLLLISVNSFALERPLEKEFTDSYKKQGHDNGQIIGYSGQVSAQNYELHKLNKINPELATRTAIATKAIEEGDSLNRAYGDETNRVIAERAKPVFLVSTIINYAVFFVALCLFIYSILRWGDEFVRQTEPTGTVRLWLFSSFAGVVLLAPMFEGGASIPQLLYFRTDMVKESIKQLFNSSEIASKQKQQFDLKSTAYDGASENVIAQLYGKNGLNYALTYLESEKYYHRNNDFSDIYSDASEYVRIGKDTIDFFMPPSAKGYKSTSEYLYSGGNIKLNYQGSMPQNTIDAIAPITIEPVDTVEAVAGKWESYGQALKAAKVDYAHIKIASFYFHNNSMLNIYKKTIQADFKDFIRAAELTEALACEVEEERKIKGRNALTKGSFEENYCLVKNGSSITVMSESGNKEASQAILTGLINKQEQIRIAVSTSFYNSLQNPDTQKILIEAVQRGSKFYFTNYLKIKDLTKAHNMLAYLLNNNIQYTATGKDSFIDDSAVSSRMNNSDLLSLSDSFSEIVSIYNAKAASTNDINYAEVAKEYLYNSANTTIDSSSTDTAKTIISNIISDYKKIYSIDDKCETNCSRSTQDSAVLTQQFGTLLVNSGSMLLVTKYSLSYFDSAADSKAAKASAKSGGSSLDFVMNAAKAVKKGLKAFFGFLMTLFGPIAVIIPTTIMVGLFLSTLVPNIIPATYNIIDTMLFLQFMVIYSFSPLILVRLFNKNDKNNWEYLAKAVYAMFGTIFLGPILIDIAFHLVVETDGRFTKEIIILTGKAFIANGQKGDLFELIANNFAFMAFAMILPYTCVTFLLKLYITMTVSVMQMLGFKHEYMSIIFRVFAFIDNVLTIICPVLWIWSGMKFGANAVQKKKAKTLDNAESKTEGKA